MNGIPTLSNNVAQVTNIISLLVADAAGIFGMFAPPQWGIYADGSPLIVADSLLDLSYRKDAKISTYPQQKGAFASYNKVQTPFDIRIKLTKGGTDADRKGFLESIDDAQKSFELYSIVMPELTYENVNITHYDYQRTSKNGLTLLTVEIWAEEIITTAEQATTKMKEPTSADPVDGGNIQANKPSIEIIPRDNSKYNIN